MVAMCADKKRHFDFVSPFFPFTLLLLSYHIFDYLSNIWYDSKEKERRSYDVTGTFPGGPRS